MIDLHTHSLASGHGTTDTISAMVKEAKQRGLSLLGIADHGPAMIGTCKESYFRSLANAPKVREGIRVLYGVEANIINQTGTLDLSNECLACLDFCIASLHAPIYQNTTTDLTIRKQENTAAYMNVIENPSVSILGHIDQEAFPIDMDAVFHACRSKHKIIELNEASISPKGYRGDTVEATTQFIQLCKNFQYPLLLSSDSHGKKAIGNFTYGLQLLNQLDFPMELVLNFKELSSFT